MKYNDFDDNLLPTREKQKKNIKGRNGIFAVTKSIEVPVSDVIGARRERGIQWNVLLRHCVRLPRQDECAIAIPGRNKVDVSGSCVDGFS